ncbi:di-/tricarboxylate transporter [Desulfitobacterium dichloroeliminans LMG P-21439]|uniref:Di-/tricarboxylate transporter n=1 Tax=Desulfitobacterium dichloroeliminans (strain LMG P-21439 / DCA1) TaxID=871963 RepID=L0FAL0_DESDL|nr:SLC13 family permease [Desulfitobacterium dichloroeliminans]AGA70040.1 di-/tricarboxylate transporter [Desulfitobacterium dichloroeliminans LMG P-21439]
MEPATGADNVTSVKKTLSPIDKKMYIHSFIGLAIIVIFWFMSPIEPITPVGMKVVGAFLGMVYLWSTVGSLWPSLLGLTGIALSGYAGQGAIGFKSVFLNAFGADTVLLTLFAMVLFGAMDEAGCTKYIARWLLTRKIINGRPYAFMGVVWFTCFVISTLVSPITGLILMWPITLRIMDTMGVKRSDKIWPYFFVGMFAVMTLGQPLFPFTGAQLIVVSAFGNMTGVPADMTPVPYAPYMALNFISTMLLLAVYILVLKFIVRPDISKLKGVDADQLAREQALPPMVWPQVLMMIMIPIYIIMLLVPSFLDRSIPVVSFLATLGPLGVTVAWVVFFCLIRYQGREVLDFKVVAYRQFNWGIFFMIAAAVYGANALSNDATGIKDFLLNALNPILGGQSEMGFVAIMFTVALIITNFANNAAMAVVLMPVILAFCGQMGLDPMPVAMGVTMMVFVAMLTPAASPHAGMMHGRTDVYNTGEIMRLGFPICVVTLVYYIFIGYPLAKLLF